MSGRGAPPGPSEPGYSGEEYRRADEEALGRQLPSGSVGAEPKPPLALFAKDTALPADAGRHAHFDPATGEVHGSGSGAGGGNPGENPDNDEDGPD